MYFKGSLCSNINTQIFQDVYSILYFYEKILVILFREYILQFSTYLTLGYDFLPSQWIGRQLIVDCLSSVNYGLSI